MGLKEEHLDDHGLSKGAMSRGERQEAITTIIGISACLFVGFGGMTWLYLALGT